MKSVTYFGVLFVLLSVLCSGQAPQEPTGRLFLKSVSIKDLLQTSNGDSTEFTVTCHTPTGAGRVHFTHNPEKAPEKREFGDGRDLGLDLLAHESVECELTESVDNEELENSHGYCELTYRRFLAPEENTVKCKLSGGSSFELQMKCEGECPEPVPAPEGPYCKRSKQLLPTDTGRSHTFTDGSPGFALYAPDSHCTWRLPRARKGVTNFLFSRLDLGSGDVITAYSSDGETRTKIKEYDDASIPESVSTSEEFLILEFKSDGADEGLGFAGFYYFSQEETPSVAITQQEDEGVVGGESAGIVGRKFE